ncbi:FkbM family methyltransferase [Mesorhizobium sp. M0954]|uniref:FkbM family methyltransferase n=1 Tax=Mesorhizobium sp. M0954 TaxID=2957032 RepID=UPI00333663FC
MTSALRQSAKRAVPKGLRQPLLHVETYAKRLGTWLSVMKHLRGATAGDVARLWMSFLASPATSARGLGLWRDPLLLRDVAVQVRGVGVFNVRAKSDDIYHVLPTRERAVFDAIRSILRPGDTFVDAGANIGFYTILGANLVGSRGAVTAVEMMPDTAARLRHHIAINGLGNVKVIEKALSNSAGDLVAAHVTAGKFGQATIIERAEGRTVEVETTTLDLLLKDSSMISLLKMDLEGAERIALKGGDEVLQRVKAVIFEYLSYETEVADFLKDRGFSVRNLDGRNSIATRD